MESSNTISHLRIYIETHLGDVGGFWEYEHTPYIQRILGTLNKQESDLFSREILNWPPSILFELADSIIFCENEYLKRDYLYCKIFSLIDDYNNLECLAENLGACFYGLKQIDYEKNMLERIKERLLSLPRKTADGHHTNNYTVLINSIDAHIN